VDWGLKRGRRTKTALDRGFPMGYTSTAPSQEKLQAAEQFWQEQGVLADAACPIACFVGTFGRQLDLETVLRAAHRLHTQGSPLRFVLCGTGDRLESLRRLAADLPTVIFPGWVDAAAIYVLMRRSSFGLDPLPNRYDFLATINNKAIEYMSAGLPVISSPNRGVLARLVAEEQCGVAYDYGDADALAAILGDLCTSRAESARLAENARRVFEDRFVAEKVYAGMMAYLENLVAIGREAGPCGP